MKMSMECQEWVIALQSSSAIGNHLDTPHPEIHSSASERIPVHLLFGITYPYL